MEQTCITTQPSGCGNGLSKRSYLKGFTLRAIPRLLSMPATPLENQFYGVLIEQLTAARKRQRISQEELSARIGVSDTMVAKWEAGLRLPTSYSLMCWAMALKVTIKVGPDA